MIPVYIVNGFFESGKTEFLLYTLAQSYFRIKGKTLLILCEEGESMYTSDLLQSTNTSLAIIEKIEDFTASKITTLINESKPERIIVEWNGMWDFRKMILLKDWEIAQQITLIDAATFSMFFTNMRSFLAEMMRESELIIMNRCDGYEDKLSNYKRNIKAINPTAEIIFENHEGEIVELLEDELPYDLKTSPIVLMNPGYGVWFLDALEHKTRYNEKIIEFVGKVLKPDSLPEDYFVPGRMVMSCCADDMTFLGYACHYKKTKELKQGEWVHIIARISYGTLQGQEESPILEAISVNQTEAPKEPIIDFTKTI